MGQLPFARVEVHLTNVVMNKLFLTLLALCAALAAGYPVDGAESVKTDEVEIEGIQDWMIDYDEDDDDVDDDEDDDDELDDEEDDEDDDDDDEDDDDDDEDEGDDEDEDDEAEDDVDDE